MRLINDAARGSASGVLKKATSKASAAKDHLGTVAPAVMETATTHAKTLSAPLGAAAAAAYSKATERFDQTRAQYKALLTAWVVQKVQRHTERLINRLPGLMKRTLEDPDMPRCVSRAKDRVVDGVWPDIREEIMWEVAVLLDRQKEDKDNDNVPGPDCFRRFFRYHILPYDKSFWGKLRDPINIAFTIFTCLPISAASPVAFLFLFLILDKSDEYQLVYFILWFKGMQFFTHGILRTILGFFLYFACVTVPRRPDEHGCENLGPGLAGNFYVILGGWVLQVVLVWLAWCLLPCSRGKGRSELSGRIEHQHTGTQRMGGYLTCFLLYDLVCFVVLCIVLVAVFILGPGAHHKEWPVAHALFACQVIYGYCSMPFFFFTLPVFSAVLTHAVPTSYDRQGRCVRYQGRPKPKKQEASQEQLVEQELVSTEETSTLVEKMKILFSGGTVEVSPDRASPGAKPIDEAGRPAGPEPLVVGGVLLPDRA
mmetsp:Transcript_41046/g.129217  ORF Transcript_41046/g.129217 Transcript_41046/m.129217 type:complete len:483 (+) Transcript_41046:2-1450(+)